MTDPSIEDLEIVNPGRPEVILAAFSRALGREAHVLANSPNLLWQQLFNRLQWEDEPIPEILSPELERRSSPGSGVWLRTRSPFRESSCLVRTLEGGGFLGRMAFAPDGSWLATPSSPGFTVWDTSTGAETARCLGHDSSVNACAVSCDGLNIATAGPEGVILWDARSLAEIGLLDRHAEAKDCSFTPDGSMILSVGTDDTLRISQVAGLRELAVLESGSRFCTVSPDGSVVAFEGPDNAVVLYDLGEGRKLGFLEGHEEKVTDCAFSPDGRTIVSASEDESLKVWDVGTLESKFTLRGHLHTGFYPGRVHGCAVTPDGRWVVSAGQDNTLRLWDVSDGTEAYVLRGHAGSVDRCAVSPTGTLLASSGWDGAVKIWDLGRLSPTADFGDHLDAIRGCAFGGDGSVLASTSVDNTVRIWNGSTGERLAVLEGHTDWGEACAVSPDSTWAVSGSADDTLRIWDVSERKCRRVLKGHVSTGTRPGWVQACAISPDGTYIVSGSDDHTLRIWDSESGEQLKVLLAHPDTVTDCVVSPDNQRIVSASQDGTLKIWRHGDWRNVGKFEGHEAAVRCCTMSPDGSRVISGGDDAVLRLWEPDSGKEVASFRGHKGRISACAMSPDGALVLSVSSDKTARVWNSGTGDCHAVFRPPGSLQGLALHPSKPSMVCGDDGGALYWIDVVGIEYGPLIVPVITREDGSAFRCPACGLVSPVAESSIGRKIECVNGDCRARLKIVQPHPGHRSNPRQGSSAIGVDDAGRPSSTAPRAREEKTTVEKVDDVMPAVRSFVGAQGMDDLRRAVEENRDLLLDETADLALSLWIREIEIRLGPDAKEVEVLKSRRSLLARCRERGIDAAFSTGPEALMWVQRFLGAGSWEECQAMVEVQPDVFLTDTADDALETMIHEAAGNEGLVREFEDHRRLLSRCREVGAERAFAEVEQGGGSIFRSRHVWSAVRTFVNAENWEEGKSIVEQESDLLLSDEAQETIGHLIEVNREDPDNVELLELHAEVLEDCRNLGIGEAFAELLE